MTPRRQQPRELRARPTALRVGTLEAQLLASADGDEAAFAALYARVAPRIYGLVLRILRDEREAEEIAAQVFVEIRQTSSRFDPGTGSAHAWLMAIAHRKAVQHVRQSRPRDDTVSVEGTDPGPLGEPASQAHSSLEVRVTPSALELAYFGGHTCHEVAQLLNVSLRTAASHIRDGLRGLQDDLSSVATEPVRGSGLAAGDVLTHHQFRHLTTEEHT
jgi:RNA polymerase sigma-70 factor, ECF subfamily